jgi:thiamine phosphate synthase YjbQ (UPF0047 family)
MRQFTDAFKFHTDGLCLIEITSAVRDWTIQTRLNTGLLTLVCRHTSASLLI